MSDYSGVEVSGLSPLSRAARAEGRSNMIAGLDVNALGVFLSSWPIPTS